MNIENSIILEIFKGISFSKKEMNLIESKLKKLKLNKGTTILKAEDKVNNQYYVYNGVDDQFSVLVTQCEAFIFMMFPYFCALCR